IPAKVKCATDNFLSGKDTASRNMSGATPPWPDLFRPCDPENQEIPWVPRGEKVGVSPIVRQLSPPRNKITPRPRPTPHLMQRAYPKPADARPDFGGRGSVPKVA